MNEPYMVAAGATIEQVEPRVDMVLVRRIPDEEATASGLILPAIARDRREGVRIGEVLRVGPGDLVDGRRISLDVQVGDRIAYKRCPDNDINVGGVDCVLLREEQHVLAILD